MSAPEDSTKRDTLTSSSGVDGGEVFAAPRLQSRLNPSAREWNPASERVPEEDRCLYLTFSKGFPLTEAEISHFFAQKYGPCVERVYVHRPAGGWRNPPLFGKVVFNKCSIPAFILNGHNQTRFVVNGRALWCKKFTPRN
ncbi:hypothetical protein L1049_019229 [Liquidambar formosana]|uniref:RRM domain-containing protein n=1 Tax=Liquidambar formosana TaxID=63359 RepID=A0AAP0RCA7_LIQFO